MKRQKRYLRNISQRTCLWCNPKNCHCSCSIWSLTGHFHIPSSLVVLSLPMRQVSASWAFSTWKNWDSESQETCLSPRQEGEWEGRPSACWGANAPPGPAPPHWVRVRGHGRSPGQGTWASLAPELPESPQTPLFSLISHWWNFLCYNFLQYWQLLARSFILSNQYSERPEAAAMPTLCCCSGSRSLEPPARSLGHLWLSADRAAHHTLRWQGPPRGRPIPACYKHRKLDVHWSRRAQNPSSATSCQVTKACTSVFSSEK